MFTSTTIAEFTFATTPGIVFGTGTSAKLHQLAGRKLGNRIVLVTDPEVRRLGLCDAAMAALRAGGTELVVFDAVEADPSRATVEAAADLTRRQAATGVVGLGGGSSMDVAKLAALLAGSSQVLDELWGVDKARGPRLPLALLPTTAGTGSEVTPISIVTLTDGEKRAVSSPLNIPDYAILDPELTLGLPPAVTAATGIDAMVHAIEGYASKSANNNPLSRTLARQALELLGSNIHRAVFEGRDLEARGGMLLGSLLAGQAFANSPVAAVHALAYPIGGTFHVPHGLSNALVLPHVLKFNKRQAAALYAELAPHAFPDLARINEPLTRCDALIDELARLGPALGLPSRLRDVGITKADLPQMARDAMKQTRLLVNNPRELGETDALAIYAAAW